MDNPEDISLFEEYLLKNLALYFEKFENELATNVSAPRAAQDAVADTGEPEFGGETEVPEFELQEVLRHLDIDDIITNLL